MARFKAARKDVAWRPSMSRAEADMWAKDSVYKEACLHVTDAVNEASITNDGFKLKEATGGRLWGEGVYVAIDNATAKQYNELWGRGSKLATLRVMLNIKNPVTILSPLGGKAEHHLRYALAELGLKEKYDAAYKSKKKESEAYYDNLPDGFYEAKAYKDARPDLRPFQLQQRVATEILAAAGHDAIIVRQNEFDWETGGSQIVVFNPKNIVVIRD